MYFKKHLKQSLLVCPWQSANYSINRIPWKLDFQSRPCTLFISLRDFSCVIKSLKWQGKNMTGQVAKQCSYNMGKILEETFDSKGDFSAAHSKAPLVFHRMGFYGFSNKAWYKVSTATFRSTP